MKKILLSVAVAALLASNALACMPSVPSGYNVTTNLVNYGTMNYYANYGGYQENVSYDYNYEANVEYDNSYCHLCGLTWDYCTCYDYQESYASCDFGGYIESYDYDYDCSYSGTTMAHWANLRDESGNIIGIVDQGSAVEVIGQCADSGRTLIYDYASGCYGTVAGVYIFGGSAWEYEHPAEWGYDYGYGCVSGDSSYDYDCSWSDSSNWDCSYTDCDVDSAFPEQVSYTCYDETTPWAADVYPGGYDCSYEQEYDYSDCSYEGYWLDVDVNADVINLVNNGVIILSGSCTCANGFGGQEFNFGDQKCAGIWNTCSEGFYTQASEYMTSGCKVRCH